MVDVGDREQLGFGFAVDDKASEPLSKIEKSYKSMIVTLERSTRDIADSLKAQSDAFGDVANEAEDAGEEQKKQTGKIGELTGAVKQNFLGLDRLGLSWKNLIKILAAVSVGGAIVGVIALLVSAVKKTAEFNRELFKLNEVYSLTAKETAVVGSALFGLEKRAGRTREEVSQLIRSMLDVGLTPKFAKSAGIAFRTLTRDILDFSSATGLSVDAATQFADQLITINKVPATRIRGIGNAIKHIADSTRISTDELAAFNKSLEPLFAFLPDQSADAREAFTLNMSALAGELSNLGIDGGKALGQFGDMLNEFSAEGAAQLGHLASELGINSNELRSMMKENPAKFFDKFSQALAGMPTKRLQLLSTFVKPLGLEFAELSRLASRGQDVLEGRTTSFEHAAIAAAKAAKIEGALAAKALKRQEQLARVTERFGKLFEQVQLKIGTAIFKHMITPLSKHLLPILNDISDWIAKQDWDSIFKSITDGLKDIIHWFRENKEAIIKWGKIALEIFIATKIGATGMFFSIAEAGLFSLGKIASRAPAVFGALKTGFGAVGLGATVAFGAAAVGIGAFAFSVHKHWDDIKYTFNEMFGTERADRWKKGIMGAFNAVKNFLSRWFGGVANLVKNIAGGKIGSVIASIFDPTEGTLFSRISRGLSSLTEAPAPTVTPPVRSPTTVGEAVARSQGGGAGAAVGAVGQPRTAFPSRMVTSSPTTERLMDQMVRLQEQVVSLLSEGGRITGGLGSRLKQAEVNRRASGAA